MNEETGKSFRIEEVEGVPPPPRARVEDAEPAADKLARKRDYLEGFLAQKPQGDNPTEPGGALYEAVIEALREIYDPEIPVNIYDLGLIYGVDISPEGDVMVTMTLTTPHCPVAESMPGEVELRVSSVPGVRDAAVFVPQPDARPAAFVVAPGLSAQQVLAALAGRLEPVFVPRPLIVVERLPRNDVGKLPREALLALWSRRHDT